ncbi:MAG: hypothetical protein IJW24_03400 [Clostridia bacterium]|nr:hypothetical protein [Clostridia bacterium]
MPINMKSYARVTGVKKFAKMPRFSGIDLSRVPTTSRGKKYSIYSGISSSTFGDVWFLLREGQALFKTFDSYDFQNTRNLRIANELVAAELLEQIHIPHAEYEPAILRISPNSNNATIENLEERLQNAFKQINADTHFPVVDGERIFNGLVSYNFLSLGEQLRPLGSMLDMDRYFDPSLDLVSEKLGDLQRLGYKVSKREIVLNLYALSVFDFLTKQTDRNSNNLNVILDEQMHIKPAKVIDNEFAFFGQYFTADRMKKNEHDIADMIKYHNNYARQISMLSHHSDSAFDRLDNTAKDIVSYACIHPEMKQILSQIIKNMDVDAAVEKTREKGIQISPEYHEFMKTVVEDGKTQLTNLMRMKISKTILEDFDELF